MQAAGCVTRLSGAFRADESNGHTGLPWCLPQGRGRGRAEAAEKTGAREGEEEIRREVAPTPNQECSVARAICSATWP